LSEIRIHEFPDFSIENNNMPYFEIIDYNTKTVIYNETIEQSGIIYPNKFKNSKLNTTNIHIQEPLILSGDILINIMHQGMLKDQILCRFQFNTAFIS
jgi:hypothetical protein